MKTTLLRINWIGLHILGIKETLAQILEECGITYKKSVCQPIADQVNFYGVENPNNVTEYKGYKFEFEEIEESGNEKK